MIIGRTVQIDHKVENQEELDAFNEYVMGLVLTIDHTPYTVSVEQTYDMNEEEELS